MKNTSIDLWALWSKMIRPLLLNILTEGVQPCVLRHFWPTNTLFDISIQFKFYQFYLFKINVSVLDVILNFIRTWHIFCCILESSITILFFCKSFLWRCKTAWNTVSITLSWSVPFLNPLFEKCILVLLFSVRTSKLQELFAMKGKGKSWSNRVYFIIYMNIFFNIYIKTKIRKIFIFSSGFLL